MFKTNKLPDIITCLAGRPQEQRIFAFDLQNYPFPNLDNAKETILKDWGIEDVSDLASVRLEL